MNNKLQNTYQIVKVIWQFATAVIKIHMWESLHIFLEPTYKLVPWLNKFDKVYSSSCTCA